MVLEPSSIVLHLQVQLDNISNVRTSVDSNDTNQQRQHHRQHH